MDDKRPCYHHSRLTLDTLDTSCWAAHCDHQRNPPGAETPAPLLGWWRGTLKVP